jgi:DNA-binding SARP family transcriptional activator
LRRIVVGEAGEKQGDQSVAVGRVPTSTISVLGRFEVRDRGELVSVPAGIPSLGLKFIAAHAGRVRTDAMAEALWPEAGPAEARKGVRNLLSRLSRSGFRLVERDGDSVRFRHDVRIDAVAFQKIADRVLLNARHQGAPDGARLALDHYVGDLLPDDMFVEWLAPLRERLARRRLALIDLLASDARRRGSRREAIYLMELGIELDPSDDLRYLEVAEMLIESGRRGKAAVFVHRSLQTLREYGLQPGPDWAVLNRQLRETAAPPGEMGAVPPAVDLGSDHRGVPDHPLGIVSRP